MTSSVSFNNEKNSTDSFVTLQNKPVSQSTNPRNINKSTIEGCRNYIEVYKTVLKCNPNNSAVIKELADSYLELTRLKITKLGKNYSFEDCLKDIDEGLSLSPDNLDLICRKGTLYLNHKPSESLKYYKLIQSKNPNYIGINHYIGKAYLALGNYEIALAEFKIQYEKTQSTVTLLKIGECYYKLQNYVEALKHLLQHRTIIKFNLDREYMVAMIYINYRRYNSALEALDKILEQSPDHTNTVFRKAYCLYATNRWREAHKVIEGVTPKTESDFESKAILYILINSRSDLDNVIVLLNQQKCKSECLPIFKAILSYMKTGKTSVLLNELRKCSSNNSNNQFLRFCKFLELKLLFEKKKYSEAVKLITTSKAIFSSATNFSVDKVVMECLMGAKPSKTQDAVDYLEGVLKNVKLTDKECTVDLTDQILDLYIGLAQCYISQKKYKRAISILEKFPEKKSDTIDLMHRLALAKCYLNSEEEKKALDLLKPIKHFSHDYFVVIVQCHIKLKEYELARKSFSEGLKTYPGNQELVKLKSEVDSLPKSAPKEILKAPRQIYRSEHIEYQPANLNNGHLQEERRRLQELKQKKDAEIQNTLDAAERKRKGDNYRPTFKVEPQSQSASDDTQDFTGMEIFVAPEVAYIKSENILMKPSHFKALTVPLKVELLSEKVDILTRKSDSLFNNQISEISMPMNFSPPPRAISPLTSESIISEEDPVFKPAPGHQRPQTSVLEINETTQDKEPQLRDLLLKIEHLRFEYKKSYGQPYEKELLYRGILLNLARYISINTHEGVTNVYKKLLSPSIEYNLEHLDNMIAAGKYTAAVYATPIFQPLDLMCNELDFLTDVSQSSESMNCLNAKEFNLIKDLVRASADIILKTIQSLDVSRSRLIYSASGFLHLNTYKTINDLPGLLNKICLDASRCKGDLAKIFAKFL